MCEDRRDRLSAAELDALNEVDTRASLALDHDIHSLLGRVELHRRGELQSEACHAEFHVCRGDHIKGPSLSLVRA